MRWVTLFIVVGLTAASARAAVTINAVESGGDVVFSGGGMLNVNALSHISSESWQGYIWPDSGDLLLGAAPASNAQTFEFYSPGITNPGLFGPIAGSSSPQIGDSGSGDRFGIADIAGLGPTVIVPDGYTSGSSLTGTLVFASTDFATLGLTQGTYTWAWGSGGDADSFTLNIVVPEPASAALLMLGGLLVTQRRHGVGQTSLHS